VVASRRRGTLGAEGALPSGPPTGRNRIPNGVALGKSAAEPRWIPRETSSARTRPAHGRFPRNAAFSVTRRRTSRRPRPGRPACQTTQAHPGSRRQGRARLPAFSGPRASARSLTRSGPAKCGPAPISENGLVVSADPPGRPGWSCQRLTPTLPIVRAEPSRVGGIPRVSHNAAGGGATRGRGCAARLPRRVPARERRGDPEPAASPGPPPTRRYFDRATTFTQAAAAPEIGGEPRNAVPANG